MSEKYFQPDFFRKSEKITKEEAEKKELLKGIEENEPDIRGEELTDEANQILAEMDGGPGAKHVNSRQIKKEKQEAKKLLRETVEKLEGKKSGDLFPAKNKK